MSDFEKILDELARAVSDFEAAMKIVQDNVLNDAQIAIKDLELTGGNIANSVGNLQKIEELKQTINNAILNDGYKDAVVKLGQTFDSIATLQEAYFSALVDTYTAPVVLGEIKNLAIETVVTDLTESGLEANVTNKLSDILKVNIESGSKYKDLVKELDVFLTDTAAGPGILQKYTGQVVTDALNQFSATYTKVATDDLGLVWFRYVGALVGGSRKLCIELEHQDFVHKSELPNIVKGIVNGKQVPLDPKTHLPYGMIPGTTAENFQVRRGGYRCNHQLQPVSEFAVPQELRDKFKPKVNEYSSQVPN